MKISQQNSGFTLIELLVVIAIIGILSSVVLASLSGARESARVTKMVSDLEQIETAMTMWMNARGDAEWPDPDTDLGLSPWVDLSTLATNTSFGDYINSVPVPEFGNEYRYQVQGSESYCGGGESSVTNGVTISTGADTPQNIAEQLDQIIDGEVDLDCGKFQWKAGSGNELFYVLSKDQSF